MGSTKITISGTMGFSIGALIIRIGFWGTLYYTNNNNNNEKPSQNSVVNY